MSTKNKVKPFTTETMTVRWSHLHAPDTKFGEDSANHSITVVVDDSLMKQIEDLKAETNSDKVNGMRDDDEGVTLLKAKSKTFVKKGDQTFPCRDAAASPTDITPFGGDRVRLRLSPVKLTRDGSLSLFLNGVQIIEKNQADSFTGGFEPTDGFTSTPKAEEDDTEEVPF